MRTFIGLLLIFQLATVSNTKAQTVIQGDTLYLGLRIDRSNASDITLALGKPNSTEEFLMPFHVLLTGGGDGHGMRLYGYLLKYRKSDIQFVLDEEKKNLTEIHFGSKAKVVTSKGIKPAKNTFGDVLSRYGALKQDNADQASPRIQNRLMNWKGEVRYTLLRYPQITFVSYGKWMRGEDVSQRRVDEIWLF